MLTPLLLECAPFVGVLLPDDSEVHKTQALSIKHLVRGCLEGVALAGRSQSLTTRRPI